MSDSLTFVLPDRTAVQASAGNDQSYAIYNYYGSGPIAAAKRRRFQLALDLAKDLESQTVVDMGTADGLLLPTLAKNYQRVVGVDINPDFVERTKRLASAVELHNVEVFCSKDISIDELQTVVGNEAKLMFLLETLEHVGAQPDIWGSKVSFLQDCFRLLQPGGRIVISVPKMVGPVMLFKNLLQRGLGLGYDKMSMKELFRSALFGDTDELEKRWDGHHVGFNHLKLDKHLEENFVIHNRRESFISVFYVIGSKE